MRRILEELYFGNIDPNTSFFPKDSNYGRAMETISDTENKLMELLEGKEKKLFLDFVNAQSEINGILSVEKFMDGFKPWISHNGGCFYRQQGVLYNVRVAYISHKKEVSVC